MSPSSRGTGSPCLINAERGDIVRRRRSGRHRSPTRASDSTSRFRTRGKERRRRCRTRPDRIAQERRGRQCSRLGRSAAHRRHATAQRRSSVWRQRSSHARKRSGPMPAVVRPHVEALVVAERRIGARTAGRLNVQCGFGAQFARDRILERSPWIRQFGSPESRCRQVPATELRSSWPLTILRKPRRPRRT